MFRQDPAHRRARLRRRHAERIASGLCTRCGRLPPEPAFKLCRTVPRSGGPPTRPAARGPAPGARPTPGAIRSGAAAPSAPLTGAAAGPGSKRGFARAAVFARPSTAVPSASPAASRPWAAPRVAPGTPRWRRNGSRPSAGAPRPGRRAHGGGAGAQSRQRDAGPPAHRGGRGPHAARGEPRPARHGGDPRQRDDDARRGGVRRAGGPRRNARHNLRRPAGGGGDPVVTPGALKPLPSPRRRNGALSAPPRPPPSQAVRTGRKGAACAPSAGGEALAARASHATIRSGPREWPNRPSGMHTEHASPPAEGHAAQHVHGGRANDARRSRIKSGAGARGGAGRRHHATVPASTPGSVWATDVQLVR